MFSVPSLFLSSPTHHDELGWPCQTCHLALETMRAERVPSLVVQAVFGALLYQFLFRVIFITLVYLWGPHWEVIFQAW